MDSWTNSLQPLDNHLLPGLETLLNDPTASMPGTGDHASPLNGIVLAHHKNGWALHALLDCSLGNQEGCLSIFQHGAKPGELSRTKNAVRVREFQADREC